MERQRLVVALATVFFLAVFNNDAAADGQWEAVPPDTGWMWASSVIRMADGTLFGGAGRDVYRSTDGGATWTSVASLPALGRLTATGGGTVLVASGTFGVTRSQDMGQTWESVGFDKGAFAARFAAADDSIGYMFGTGSGVYSTTDGGLNWTLASVPPGTQFLHLAVDAGDPSTVFVGTDSGLYRSRDGGGTWEPSASELGFVRSVETTQVPGVVFVSGLRTAGGARNFRSTDGGDNWSEITDPTVAQTMMRWFEAAADDPDRVFAGAMTANVFSDLPLWFSSADGGVTWDPAPPPDGEWYPLTTGLYALGSKFVLATERGMFTSNDGGATWSAGAGIRKSNVSSFAFGAVSGELYAGSTESGVHASTDGGTTWVHRVAGLGKTAVTAVAANPTISGHVLAATRWGHITKSTDGGATWTASTGATTGLVSHIAFDPVTPTLAYALDVGQGAILVTTDGGGSWSIADNGLPAAGQAPAGFGSYRRLAVAHDGSAVFAPLPSGLYKSTDAGSTWAVVAGISGVSGVTAHPTESEVIFAAGTGPEGAGLYKSSDAGDSWTRLLAGIVSRVAVDRHNPDRMLANNGDGVLGSIDGGTTWHTLNQGLDPAGGTGLFDPASYDGTYPATVDLAFDPFLSTRYFIANGTLFSTAPQAMAWLQRYVGSIAADLAVSTATSSHTVAVGTATDVAFTISHKAGDPAKAVSLTISRPSALTLSNASLSGGQCTAASGNITCTRQGLPAGAEAAGTVRVTLNSASTANLTLAVSAETAENAPSDNSTTVQFTPQATQNPPPPPPPPPSGKSGGGSGGWWWSLAALPLAMRRRTIAA